jgi:hypothetical protein
LTVSEISSPIHLHILTVGKIQQWRWSFDLRFWTDQISCLRSWV